MWLALLMLLGGVGIIFFKGRFRRGKLDNWEPPGERIAVRAKMRIRYLSFDGKSTERDIKAKAYFPEDGHLSAWCRLRREKRIFRIDRIKQAVDLETGEIVTKKLPAFLMEHRR